MDAISRINILRAKFLAGEEPTKEESAEAIQLLRSDRAAVLDCQIKKFAPVVDLDSLFNLKP